jgi:hypothetical protein
VKYQWVLTKTLRCQMLQSTMTLSITESTAANECTTVAVLMNARAEATKWYSNEGCP